MTIERLSFPEGISLGQRGNIEQLIREIVKKHKDKAVPLPEGKYLLNPPIWPESVREYLLEVLSDGRALYCHPISDKKYKIPQDYEKIILTGIYVVGGKPDLKLYEHISYVPGPAPQK